MYRFRHHTYHFALCLMIPDDLAQPQLTFWLHMVNRVSFLDEKPLGLGVAIISSGLRHIAILRVFKPLSDSDAIAGRTTLRDG